MLSNLSNDLTEKIYNNSTALPIQCFHPFKIVTPMSFNLNESKPKLKVVL